MIDIHLYGKLRHFAEDTAPTAQSVARVSWQRGDTIHEVIDRLGIEHDDLGSNVFLNGRYADLESPVQDGDRIGLFPNDMQLLYKWYFASSQGSRAPNQDSVAQRSGDPKPCTDDSRDSKDAEK